MIFIFGFNHQKYFNEGPLEKEVCKKCRGEDFWILEKISHWFTVFFIPLIPYKTNYYKRCPICNFQLPLQKEEFEVFKVFANLNLQVIDGKISEEEYNSRKLTLSKEI